MVHQLAPNWRRLSLDTASLGTLEVPPPRRHTITVDRGHAGALVGHLGAGGVESRDGEQGRCPCAVDHVQRVARAVDLEVSPPGPAVGAGRRDVTNPGQIAGVVLADRADAFVGNEQALPFRVDAAVVGDLGGVRVRGVGSDQPAIRSILLKRRLAASMP